MSDLVKRLREGGKNPSKFDNTGWTAATCGIVSEAADRIEHLEHLVLLAKIALEYHTQQTRPIYATNEVIAYLNNQNTQGKENDPSKL